VQHQDVVTVGQEDEGIAQVHEIIVTQKRFDFSGHASKYNVVPLELAPTQMAPAF
jgi:hypothetical protein